jgi:hypothetical protein
VGTFVRRLIGAATLNARVYESVEADRSALGQALVVVLLSSAAAGVGLGRAQPGAILAVTMIALVSWLAWAAIVYQIGGRLLPEPGTRVDFAEMLRTVGFAASPGLIQALAAIPGWTAVVVSVSWIWMIAAMVTAVGHALDYRRVSRTLAVCVIAAAVAIGMAVVLGLLLTPTTVGESGA